MPRQERLLAQARELVSASWTQHADARNGDGDSVEAWDPAAVSWSLIGALVMSYERLLWSDGELVAIGELASSCSLLAGVLDTESLVDWNDVPGRTQADVLGALDEAAAAGSDGFSNGGPA